jgi:DNA-binding NtrC family response regulator
LAEHFLERFKREYELPELELTAAARRTLTERAWPGNVRELRNCVERIVLLEDGDEVQLGHLPPELLGQAASLVDSNDGSTHRLPTLAQMEAEHIAEVLRLTAGNKSRAARILGISRQGLIEKLRRSRLEEPLGRQVS